MLDIAYTNQRGEKGVLQALARAHYDFDTIASLRESVRLYQDALQLFGRGRTQLPEYDVLSMNIAKIRTQHHRGNLTVQFLRAIKFQIIRANLLPQTGRRRICSGN
jgi:hypothetical protein